MPKQISNGQHFELLKRNQASYSGKSPITGDDVQAFLDHTQMWRMLHSGFRIVLDSKAVLEQIEASSFESKPPSETFPENVLVMVKIYHYTKPKGMRGVVNIARHLVGELDKLGFRSVTEHEFRIFCATYQEVWRNIWLCCLSDNFRSYLADLGDNEGNYRCGNLMFPNFGHDNMNHSDACGEWDLCDNQGDDDYPLNILVVQL